MAAARCSACDARLPRGASWCHVCGAAAPGSTAAAGLADRANPWARDVQVQAVDEPFAERAGEEVAIGGGQRGRGAAIGAAFAAALIAGSVLVSRDGGGEAASATTSTTAVTTTTTRPRPPTSARPTPTTVPLTPVEVPAPAQGLLLLSAGGETVMVDLSSSATRRIEGQLDVWPGVSIVQLGDALVGTFEGQLRAVPLDGGPARPFSASGFTIFGEPGDIGRAWVWLDQTTVQEVTARGDNVGTGIPFPQGTYPVAYVDGAFVLSGAGRLFRWEPRSGAVTHIADVAPSGPAVGGRFLLGGQCDDEARCRIVVVDVTTGDVSDATSSTDALDVTSGESWVTLSPDGRYVVEVSYGDSGSLRLIERASGVVRTAKAEMLLSGDGVRGGESITSVAFSADSTQLWFIARTRLFVWILGEADPQPVAQGDLYLNSLVIVPTA
jgi:hypothetical protein